MKLTTRIKQCTKCTELAKLRTNVVIGEGPIPCSIVFLGEAPGRKEDLSGNPFCGMSGDILEAAAFKAKLHRLVDYHILNVLKCRPPKNRDPLQSELLNCRPFLEQQLKIVAPKVVVAFGKYAQAYILRKSPHRTPVQANMGKIVKHPNFYAVLSCHPAFVARNPDIRKALEKHIRLAKRIADGKKPKCDVQIVE